ncbi:MAG: CsbD family protein [Ancalomicrobiaceae bacterium]|nr:CsbD family protein [Ancalomicrobiaceae bacterium]
MGSSSDKAKGVGNQVIGKAKQAVGDISSDEALRQKGLDQEAKGIGQKTIGDAKAAVKKLIDNS